MENSTLQITVFPATAERWPDLEALFGDHGAYGNCWCTFWRIKRSEFSKMKGEEKKALWKEWTTLPIAPGVLAYDGDKPVGWCAIQPRQNLYPLANSKIFKPVDDQPVWSMPCFFVHKSYRDKGLMRILIQGAVDYAGAHGARIVEVYPFESEGQTSTMNIYKGVVSAFRDLGFVEVERRKSNRPIMRKFL